MPQIAFDELPGDARVWIFSAARKLTEPEQARLLAEVDAFINQWGAHAVPLTAGRNLVYAQFLFIAVDQRAAGPSGCSIDALVRRMKELQEEPCGRRRGWTRYHRVQQYADESRRSARGTVGSPGS